MRGYTVYRSDVVLKDELKGKNQMRISKRFPRYSTLPLLVLIGISGWAVVSTYLPKATDRTLTRANAIEPAARRQLGADSIISLHAQGRGNPSIRVDDGRDLATNYFGNPELTQLGLDRTLRAAATVPPMVLLGARSTKIGIYLFGGTTDTLVQGNFIGTDVKGTVALGNIFFGVITNLNTFHNTIGGVIAGARNIISGNTRSGMTLNWSDSQVQGNFIGTDVTGTVALGNGETGVVLSGARNLIGGIEDGDRNIVSGNRNNGISITSAGNQVQGNFIGTDVTGAAAMGNGSNGVFVSTSGNLIGGASPGARNVISANGFAGISFIGPAGNRVEGNVIGTDVTGNANLGNALYGVQISSTLTGNIIGGTVPGAGNTIAFNGGPGVNVVQSSGNAIRRNSIFANGGLGIDLGGNLVTPNDQCDSDSGANNLQNFPVITSVVSSDASTVIAGTLNSRPGSTFSIEFFSNNSCDILGNGEGQTFIGSITITTDANCNASFSASLPVSLSSGRVIAATATDSSNNTSEFSQCFPDGTVSGARVFEASIEGKDLFVIGEGFDNRTVILLNSEAQRTKNDARNPTRILIGKKVGKKIAPGQTVAVRVLSGDGLLSNQIIFTR